MLTIVRFSDINGSPMIKLDLPESMRIGDPLALSFLLERQNGGRLEVLSVMNGKFRVETVGYDASRTPQRRLLNVETVGKPPTWQSVRKRSQTSRRLGPTRFEPTSIGDKK